MEVEGAAPPHPQEGPSAPVRARPACVGVASLAVCSPASCPGHSVPSNLFPPINASPHSWVSHAYAGCSGARAERGRRSRQHGRAPHDASRSGPRERGRAWHGTSSTSSTISSLGECFSILTRGEGTKTPPPRPRALVTLIGHAAPILTGTTQLPIERAWGFRSRGSL